MALLPTFLATVGAFAITPQEAANAILSRNGDRLQIAVEQNAKDLESRTIANAPDPSLEGDYMVMPEGVDNRWNVAIGYEMPLRRCWKTLAFTNAHRKVGRLSCALPLPYKEVSLA